MQPTVVAEDHSGEDGELLLVSKPGTSVLVGCSDPASCLLSSDQSVLPLAAPFAHIVEQSEVPRQFSGTESMPSRTGTVGRTPQMIFKGMAFSQVVDAMSPQGHGHTPAVTRQRLLSPRTLLRSDDTFPEFPKTDKTEIRQNAQNVTIKPDQASDSSLSNPGG
jgi:hypothetical protein